MARRKLKFTPAAIEVYNKVYNQSINKQINYKHPDTPVIDQKYWETICHNFAYLAATAYEGYDLEIIKTKGGNYE